MRKEKKNGTSYDIQKRICDHWDIVGNNRRPGTRLRRNMDVETILTDKTENSTKEKAEIAYERMGICMAK